MDLVGAFNLSDSLMCLAIIMDYEYDVSFSVWSVCFHCVQMWIFAWAHTGREVSNFPLLNLIRHLLLLRVTLLDVGSGRREALLLTEASLFGGLSFLYSSPPVRLALPQAIRCSIPPPASSPLASGIHKLGCVGIRPLMLPSKQMVLQRAVWDCLILWRIWG